MSYNRACDAFCPDMGYCANRNDRECEGFAPMDGDGLIDDEDSDSDPMEQMIEQMTY